MLWILDKLIGNMLSNSVMNLDLVYLRSKGMNLKTLYYLESNNWLITVHSLFKFSIFSLFTIFSTLLIILNNK